MNDINKIEETLKSVDDIILLYNEYGIHDYIGEDVSQVEHSIQAALRAKGEGYDDECVVAALLHDIGHLIGMKYDLEEMENLGCVNHENIGYCVLKKMGFSERLCLLVKNHVNAKRYLVTINPQYHNGLSAASQQTFIYQGGKMNENEIKEFEKDEYFNLYIKIREWDDKAKVKNLVIPSISDFREVMVKLLIF